MAQITLSTWENASGEQFYRQVPAREMLPGNASLDKSPVKQNASGKMLLVKCL